MNGNILALASCTFLETVRDRIFYLVAVFGFIMLASTAILSPLTVGAQGKIMADVGLASMVLFGLLVDDHCVAVTERPAATVLARQPHRSAFGQQRSERQRFTHSPIDRSAFGDCVAIVIDQMYGRRDAQHIDQRRKDGQHKVHLPAGVVENCHRHGRAVNGGHQNDAGQAWAAQAQPRDDETHQSR